MAALKAEREVSSWGREVALTSGRQRKWVSWGFFSFRWLLLLCLLLLLLVAMVEKTLRLIWELMRNENGRAMSGL